MPGAHEKHKAPVTVSVGYITEIIAVYFKGGDKN